MWPEVQILSLEELHALPRITDHSNEIFPGVYFLWEWGPRLVYIGSSKRTHSRPKHHRHHGLYFEYATVLEVPHPWHAAVELLYIERYKPHKNRHHNPVARTVDGRRGRRKMLDPIRSQR